MSKKYLLVFTLIVFMMAGSCWLPPYDADAANSIYMLSKMDFIGDLDLQILEDQGLPVHFNNEDFFNNRISMKVYTPSPKSMAYCVISDQGTLTVLPLNSNMGLIYELGFSIAEVNETNTNFVFSADLETDSIFPARYQLLFFTGSSLYFNKYEYDTSTPPSSWSSPAVPPLNNTGTYVYSSYRYFETGGINDYIYYLDGNIIKHEGVNGTANQTTLFSLPIAENSRIAYDEASDTVVLNLPRYNNYSYKFINTTTLPVIADMAEMDSYRIKNLDNEDKLIAALDDGSFLFQRMESYDSTVFTLWYPGGSTKTLPAGKLFVTDHFWIGGTHYLGVVYYLEDHSNNEETRKLKFFMIKDADFRSLFD